MSMFWMKSSSSLGGSKVAWRILIQIVRSWLRGLKRRRSVGRMLGGVVLEGMAMVVSSMETRGGARSGMNGGVAPSVAASGSNSAQVEAAGGDGAVFD